jgi:hypothetical protein
MPPCAFCEDGGTYDKQGKPYLPADSDLDQAPINVYRSQAGFGWCYEHRSCGYSSSRYDDPGTAGDAGRHHLTECAASRR